MWSLSELIQAMLILLHFQTLSGFVYGCGVAPEIDLCDGILQLNSVISIDDNEFSDKLLKTRSVSKFDTGTTAELYQKMQQISSESDGHVDEVSEKLRQFKEVEIKEGKPHFHRFLFIYFQVSKSLIKLGLCSVICID